MATLRVIDERPHGDPQGVLVCNYEHLSCSWYRGLGFRGVEFISNIAAT